MIRWALGIAAAMVVLAMVGRVVARRLGARASRMSSLVAVVTHWLAAYVLWSFAAGVALHHGLIAVYEPMMFVALAVVAGIWDYRARVAESTERGRIIFVGSQFVWLVILLLQNRALWR